MQHKKNLVPDATLVHLVKKYKKRKEINCSKNFSMVL